MKLNKITIFFSIYIILSAIFMRQAWEFAESIVGINALNYFLLFLCLSLSLWLIYLSNKSKIRFLNIFLSSLIYLGVTIFAARQPFISERAHVIEFAFLGWLVAKDLSKPEKKSFLVKLVFAAIYTGTIGYLAEGFQKFLPGRVYDIRDIITNVLSGLIGIGIFNFNKKQLS